jgi:E3 ubiquitin-protein ligase UBR1
MIEILEIWYRQSERTGTSEEVAVAPDFHLLVPMPPRNPELITPASRAKFVKSLNHIHKRGLFLMSHLRECLWYKEVAQIVRQDRALLERLLQFIDLFDGIQPQRREVAQHLQYEVDWSGVFRTLAELAQTIRRFGECFVGADAGISSLSIVIVARRIRSNELFQTPTLDPAQWRQPEFKKVRPVLHEHNQSPSAGEDMEVIDCNLIRHSLFSFSSPSHYLLGWLIKGLAATDYSFSGLMSGASFTELFLISIEGRPGHGSVFPDTEISDRPLLLLINQPLSSKCPHIATQSNTGLTHAEYVITRHIRADLWRRNGRAMRDQQGSYIDRARRDVTFDLEFYILQSALCALGPAHFVGIAIMRFQLEKLFREEGERSIIWNHSKEFTPNMIATALEDFLWMLIWLVTDTDQIKPASLEDFTRKWLIQDLAPSPLLYSEISTRMLDRMNRRIDLPAALAEVSDYRAPTETAPGCYVLHEELMSKVNLLWRHYTRNERDVVLTRIEKFTFDPQADPSRSPDDWYFTPPLPEYPPSPQPFSNLGEIFHSEVAARITHFVVWHCLMMENGKAFIDRPVDDRPHLDQVFSLVIYFAMIAVGVDAEKFTAEAIKGSRIDCPPKQHVANSLFQNLWYISVSDRPVWKPFMPRVKHVLDRMVQHLPPQSAAEFYTISEEMARVAELFKSADKEAGAAEKAKEKAAARQKQLMAEFAKKQADFTALMAEGEDGDESMDEDVVHTDDNTSYGPCIVCQDPVTATSTGGLLALFQPSRTIREAHHDLEYFEKSLETPSSLDEHQEHNLTTDWAWNDDFDELVPVYAHSPESLRFGAYVSACGHLMHEECMEAYSDGTRVRHAQQVARHQPENSIRHEYMCPLCKSIGNFLLPIDFAADKIGAINFRRDVTGHPIALLDHIRAVSHEGLRGVNDSSKVWQDHTEDGRLRCWMADEPARWNSKRKRRQDMRGLNRMIDKYRHLFASLSDQSELMRQSHKSMYMPEDLVGYTISMLEIAQRGMGRSATQRTVVDQIPETSRKVVKKLIEELQLELDGHFGGQINPTGTGNRETKPGRTTLRVCLFARFLPDWYRASSLTVPLLARDPLSMVIECAAIAPDLLHPVIVMSYYAEVCRALIHITIMLRRCILSWRSHDSSTTADPWQFYKAKDPFTESAKEIFGDFAPVACDLFRNAAPFNDVNSIIRTASKELLSKLLYMYTLPFLRRAAIVFHAVHGNYPNRAESGIVTEGCEYGRLMSLMSINPIASALAETSSVENAMIHRWFSHWAISGRHVPAIESGGPYELLALPECHDDMVNYYEGRVCQHCFQEPTNPGVCLFCRTVVCINGDCCSEGEQGECNLHMRQYVFPF